MAVRTELELKNYFKQGSKPTSGMYSDLIETIFSGSGGELATTLGENVIERTLFVNMVNTTAQGDGEKGKIYRPFKDINTAIQNAVSGDTIIVYPGDYVVGNMFVPGVKFFLMPGVNIENFNNSSALFNGDGSASSCEVFGYGNLKTAAYQLVELNASEKLKLACSSILVDIPGTGFTVGSAAKLMLENVTINSSANNTDANAVIENSGTVRLRNVDMLSSQVAGSRKDSIGGNGNYEMLGPVNSNMNIKAGTSINFGQFSVYAGLSQF